MNLQSDGGQRELILQVATRLFAALGYDGTSARQIAEAAGVDVATIKREIGDKRDIYLAVMDQAYQMMKEVLDAAAAEFQETRSIHLVLDRYLDFCVETPEIISIWIHRWLSDALDVGDLEQRYIMPLSAMFVEAFSDHLRHSEADVEYMIWTIIWCCDGFVKGGVMEIDGRLHRASEPETLERFRSHMHRLVHRHFGLPGEPPAGESTLPLGRR
ncbi:TetR/AcrR family transcriptional regulator [Nonomuraea pusilla]|uniref:TetR/AcrR family transcriptional regulator n=1 Tax=Nonomuraea pusilla TaxID=46177 RepID=UPI00331FF056